MSDSSNQNKNVSSILFTIASLFIVGAGIYCLKPILMPLFFSIFIAFMFTFPMFWLKKQGLSLQISLLVTITLIFFGGVFLLILINSSLNNLSQEISLSSQKMALYLKSLHLENLSNLHFNVMGIEIKPDINLNQIINKIFSLTVFNIFTGILTQSVLIFAIVFFILLEIPHLSLKINKIFLLYNLSSETFEKVMHSIQSYMFIKTLTSLITALIIAICIACLGVKYCILWGVLAFFLNFIPNIGSILAACPPIILTLIQQNTKMAFFVFLIYLVVNLIVANVIEPKWMGKELGLSTLVVFLSFISWGFLLGTIGIILAVPLTVIVKITCESHKKTQWISVLLGNGKTLL